MYIYIFKYLKYMHIMFQLHFKLLSYASTKYYRMKTEYKFLLQMITLKK